MPKGLVYLEFPILAIRPSSDSRNSEITNCFVRVFFTGKI
jgi:hypothetical protein